MFPEDSEDGNAQDGIGFFKLFYELRVIDRRNTGRMNVVPQHEAQVAPLLGAKIFHGLGDLHLNLIAGTAVTKNQDLEALGLDDLF